MPLTQKELAIIKAHFPSFAKFVYPKYKFAPHLLEIAEAFRGILNGEIKRLIINMPPRFGKSLTTSTIFPAWYLINKPDHRVLFTSYEANFAASFGMKARDIVDEYGKYWDIHVNKKSKAKNSWDIKNHLGGMNTAGVGGSITGRGADVLIIDDPIKNAEEALSPARKQAIRDWFDSTAYTRLEPDGVLILIQTRWSVDDLTGQLLQEDIEDWHTLIYPALDENGNSVWEERFSTKRMHEIKKTIGDFWFNCLYMQDPRLKEGGMFYSGNFIETNNVEGKIIKRVRAWDFGVVGDTSEDPDYTVGVLMEMDEHGSIYIRDVVRFRTTPAKMEKKIKEVADSDPYGTIQLFEQQPGVAGTIMKSNFTSLLSNHAVAWMFPSQSKEKRAFPLSSAVETGKVKIFPGKWTRDFLEEFDNFIPDQCSHDDQVDATAMGYNYLTGMEKQNITNFGRYAYLNSHNF